ncbi:ABC transporter ATP-binding protein [Paractinoplanes toevensis]|nr:ABC transporter ATP-binding protein [Actinoplanes toevensis]
MLENDLSPKLAAVIAPALLLVAACIVAGLVDIWRGPAPRYLPRAVWTAVALASFPWGLLAYLFLGRGTRTLDEGPSAPGTAGDTSFDVVDPVLRTTDLVRRYPDGTGVLGVGLVVPRRGIYGLVGPNGSGKTTLLALIAGVRRPDAGRVERAFPAARLAICPDVPEFEPWLTAREVVDLARRLTAPDRPAEATAAILAEVGLAGAADRRVGGFSRGMTQRLGLAVALIGYPELIIMDEPTAALDPAGRAQLVALLKRVAERTAVLISSHDLTQIQQAAWTVGVMHHGRLVYQGPTSGLTAFDPQAGPGRTGDLERAFLALTGALTGELVAA